jgi:hypothetical protein
MDFIFPKATSSDFHPVCANKPAQAQSRNIPGAKAITVSALQLRLSIF